MKFVDLLLEIVKEEAYNTIKIQNTSYPLQFYDYLIFPSNYEIVN